MCEFCKMRSCGTGAFIECNPQTNWIAAITDNGTIGIGHEGETTNIQAKFCFNCAEPLTEPKALTLEKLKNMQNAPVWIKQDYWQGWAICNGFEWRQGHQTDWIIFSNIESLYCDDYGETWVAYSQEPGKDGV